MQYELYMIRNIVKLIDKNILLTSLTPEERVEATRVNLDKTMDINEIQAQIKKQADYIILKYGFLEVLRRLVELRKDYTSLQMSSQNPNNPAGIQFFSIPLTYFYRFIEEIYSPNVFFKVYSTIPKLANGNLDAEEFLSYVTRDSIAVERALGLKNEDEWEQDSLFQVAPKPTDAMECYIRSLNFRQSVAREIKTVLRSSYTPRELSEYCTMIVELLNTSSKSEHAIITRIITRNIAPSLIKSAQPKEVTKGELQLTIKNYNGSDDPKRKIRNSDAYGMRTRTY